MVYFLENPIYKWKWYMIGQSWITSLLISLPHYGWFLLGKHPSTNGWYLGLLPFQALSQTVASKCRRISGDSLSNSWSGSAGDCPVLWMKVFLLTNIIQYSYDRFLYIYIYIYICIAIYIYIYICISSLSAIIAVAVKSANWGHIRIRIDDSDWTFGPWLCVMTIFDSI